MTPTLLDRCDVVLVGTSNPENLGGVARLLANFGVGPPSLVAPRVDKEDHRALVVGRAALDRLTAARLHPTLESAVGGASLVIGFSARRGKERPGVGLRALAPTLEERAPSGRLALVFGPEDSGLRSDDVERCDLLCAIETPGPLASFNLTQAVAVALWELARPSTSPPRPLPRAAATRSEIEAFLDHALAALTTLGYLGPDEAATKRVHLRRLLGAAHLNREELAGLHGICAQIERRLR